MLPRNPKALVYVQHFASGTDLFRVICDRDMEGVVAMQASAKDTPEATTWVKIKNGGRPRGFFSAAEGKNINPLRYRRCRPMGAGPV